MDEDYDVIVLGTGLTECVLSGLMSTEEQKVLHMDRNNYYGGESASLNLKQLWNKFANKDSDEEVEVDEKTYGRSRDYNIDLCPKFIMACGNLVKILLHTKVTRYLDFRSVTGSFVVKDNTPHKVPATAAEALSSSLMGFFQKRRFKGFVNWANDYDENRPETWQKLDVNKVTSRQVFEYFKLDDDTVAFTGHALALYLNDDYLDRPAKEMMQRVKLYAYSVSRYGSSPFIYPLWGLGGLPESFSRLSAVHGGVYMLNKQIDEIIYGEDGKVTGVRSGDETVRCKKLVADPTYFLGTDKVRSVGKIARSICILNHPVANTNDADSAQIILPASTLPNRKRDLYVSVVSHHHNVAAEGKWLAVVSGYVETKEPHRELIPALKLLGDIDKEFFFVSDLYEPTSDGKDDNVFISKSYDATSHFETATNDIMDIYQRLTGKEVDLTHTAEPEDLENV